MKSNKNTIIVVIVSIIVIACIAIGRSSNSSAGGTISASNNTTTNNNSVSITTYPNSSYQTTQAVQTTQAPQTSYYNSSMGISAPGFVSYNTPYHAGLNVRNAPSVDATLLTTLPEGEKLMYFPDSIQNGYIYCELSGLIDGIIYGWLLAEYVMVE